MARVFEGHRRDQIHVRCVDSSGAAPPVVAAATASASSTAAASSSSAASTVALSSATAATVASIATVVGGCEEAATLARDATPPQVLEPLPRQPATCLYLCSRLPRASAFQRHSTTAAGGEGGRRRLHSHPRRPQRPPQHLVRIGHQRRMGPRRWDRVSRLVGPLHALVRSTTQIRPRAAVAPSQARARLTDFAALDHPGHTEGSRPALLAARQAPVSKSHPATHTHTWHPATHSYARAIPPHMGLSLVSWPARYLPRRHAPVRTLVLGYPGAPPLASKGKRAAARNGAIGLPRMASRGQQARRYGGGGQAVALVASGEARRGCMSHVPSPACRSRLHASATCRLLPSHLTASHVPSHLPPPHLTSRRPGRRRARALPDGRRCGGVAPLRRAAPPREARGAAWPNAAAGLGWGRSTASHHG